MISKLAKGTACFFVDNKIIEVEDSEVYAYGIELLLSTIFNLIIAIIIALISNEWNCQEMCSRGIPKIMDRQESGGVMRELL